MDSDSSSKSLKSITKVSAYSYDFTINFSAQPLHSRHADIHQFRALLKRHISASIFKKCTLVLCEIAICTEIIQFRYGKIIHFQESTSYLSVKAFISSSLVFFKPSMLFPVILFSIKQNMLRIRRFISSRLALIEL